MGYWTGNGCIDRTVEAPIKPSGLLVQRHLLFINCTPVYNLAPTIRNKGGGNRGAKGAMAPLKIFLEGPGPSKLTDDPSSVMNFYSTLYI